MKSHNEFAKAKVDVIAQRGRRIRRGCLLGAVASGMYLGGSFGELDDSTVDPLKSVSDTLAGSVLIASLIGIPAARRWSQQSISNVVQAYERENYAVNVDHFREQNFEDTSHPPHRIRLQEKAAKYINIAAASAGFTAGTFMAESPEFFDMLPNPALGKLAMGVGAIEMTIFGTIGYIHAAKQDNTFLSSAYARLGYVPDQTL